LIALGWFSFRQLPVTRFPNVDVPVVQVTITQAGAAPSELETQVAKKVEDAIAGLTSVKHVHSTIVEGSSTTVIEFELQAPVDRAVNDVKDAVARIRSELPRSIDEPITQRLDIEGLPILTYAARAPTMTPEALSWFVDDTVARTLQSVKGVAKIERIGGVEREIRVALDPDRLLALGIAAGDVNRQLRETNVDVAGGRGEIGGREQAIRTLAGKKTIGDLTNSAIALPGGRHVRLDALGTVSDTVAEPRQFADLNGEPVVAFAVLRGKGASEVVVADGVAAKLEELKRTRPDVELKLIDSPVAYTVGVYNSTMKTLIEGAVLAVLVVFVFLRDVRATLLAAIALPLSIIPTFWAMAAMGFSLNLVSLLSPLSRASWSTTPSLKSKTSCVTSTWASRPTGRRSKPPTRSDLW
jgi:multidrug efflux pump subunit AcrB